MTMSHLITVEEATQLSGAQIREVVNKWSLKGFFRIKGMGNKIEIQHISPFACHVARLKTQYEYRSIKLDYIPYSGGPVDDKGLPPRMWDIKVERPTDFRRAKEKRVIPHTERVERCGGCGGSGRITCSGCGGTSQVSCSSCGGGGRVWVSKINYDRNVSELVSETCYGCGGSGRTHCYSCSSGYVTCSQCGGHGRIKIYDLLTVQFDFKELSHVANTTKISDRRISKAVGDVVADVRESLIGRCPLRAHEIEQPVNALLTQANSVKHGESQILFQHLVIRRVNTYEVSYKYRDKVRRPLWVYGNEQVYAPSLPLAMGRVAIVVGAVVAVVGSIATILVYRGHV